MNKEKVGKAARKTIIELQRQSFSSEETLAFMRCLMRVYGIEKRTKIATWFAKLKRQVFA